MRYIIANWKMAPPTRQEAEKLFAFFRRVSRDAARGVRIIVCPPFVWLPFFQNGSTHLALGAQDVFWAERGAYTGEISLPMLASLGVSSVIVGHSERRAMGEDNALVQKKLRAVLDAGMTAILCVGETSRSGEGNGQDWHEFLREEVESALAGVQPKEAERLMVAYEPVWAIGGSTPDTPDNVLTVALLIRKLARRFLGGRAAENLIVLYGGSVEAGTVNSFAGQEGIDGILVGHASLDPEAFATIVRAFGEE